MTVEECARALELAREELEAASSALRGKHRGGEWERYRAAHDRCISLERELARATDSECAAEIPWSPPWDVGAPLPHVLSSGLQTFVIYNMREANPGWDGSSAHRVDPASGELRLIAMVEFERCIAHRLGPPNDEALHGHPLHGRGLVAYGAHIVERSRWIAELMKINSVHSQYDPERWAQYQHYLLAFHDQTLECIARGYTCKQTLSSFTEALGACVKALVGQRSS